MTQTLTIQNVNMTIPQNASEQIFLEIESIVSQLYPDLFSPIDAVLKTEVLSENPNKIQVSLYINSDCLGSEIFDHDHEVEESFLNDFISSRGLNSYITIED